MAEPALTLADQAFLNLAAAICFWSPDRADRTLCEGLARDLLPRVNRGHRYLRPVIDAFEDWDCPVQARRFAAMPRLQGAVHDFLRWRGLLAMDALHRQEQGAA